MYMATQEAAPAVRPSSSPLATAAQWLATGFGSGYSPIAPGTAGTVVGLALFWPLHSASLLVQVVATLVVFAVGVAAADLTARRTGLKDPSIVVVDEIVGMWISLLFLPWNPVVVIAAFLLFRVMDVVKPPPARGFESLPGGWGIVMDDVMAGVYANLVLRIGLWIWAAF
jgi:phosphatidylglycerophosphatase A